MSSDRGRTLTARAGAAGGAERRGRRALLRGVTRAQRRQRPPPAPPLHTRHQQKLAVLFTQKHRTLREMQLSKKRHLRNTENFKRNNNR